VNRVTAHTAQRIAASRNLENPCARSEPVPGKDIAVAGKVVPVLRPGGRCSVRTGPRAPDAVPASGPGEGLCAFGDAVDAGVGVGGHDGRHRGEDDAVAQAHGMGGLQRRRVVGHVAGLDLQVWCVQGRVAADQEGDDGAAPGRP